MGLLGLMLFPTCWTVNFFLLIKLLFFKKIYKLIIFSFNFIPILDDDDGKISFEVRNVLGAIESFLAQLFRGANAHFLWKLHLK